MGLRDTRTIDKGCFHIQLLEYRKMGRREGGGKRICLLGKGTPFKVKAAYSNETLNLPLFRVYKNIS